MERANAANRACVRVRRGNDRVGEGEQGKKKIQLYYPLRTSAIDTLLPRLKDGSSNHKRVDLCSSFFVRLFGDTIYVVVCKLCTFVLFRGSTRLFISNFFVGTGKMKSERVR